MKIPSEIMSENYNGPAKVIPLWQIRNQEGFRFIGVDRNGGEHWCIVRRGEGNNYYMSSNTVMFCDLIGWVPDNAIQTAKLMQ